MTGWVGQGALRDRDTRWSAPARARATPRKQHTQSDSSHLTRMLPNLDMFSTDIVGLTQLGYGSATPSLALPGLSLTRIGGASGWLRHPLLPALEPHECSSGLGSWMGGKAASHHSHKFIV